MWYLITRFDLPFRLFVLLTKFLGFTEFYLVSLDFIDYSFSLSRPI